MYEQRLDQVLSVPQGSDLDVALGSDLTGVLVEFGFISLHDHLAITD